jgi:hypothetical protein
VQLTAEWSALVGASFRSEGRLRVAAVRQSRLSLPESPRWKSRSCSRCVFLNGAFAMSEIALVAARKGRLQASAYAGDKSAAIAIELGQEPTRFLSAIQIGITSIGS